MRTRSDQLCLCLLLQQFATEDGAWYPLHHRDPSTENEGMWRLLAGVAGVVGVVIVVVHIRRRAAARKDIELGAVSQIWVAEHRGGTINTFHSTTAER